MRDLEHRSLGLCQADVEDLAFPLGVLEAGATVLANSQRHGEDGIHPSIAPRLASLLSRPLCRTSATQGRSLLSTSRQSSRPVLFSAGPAAAATTTSVGCSALGRNGLSGANRTASLKWRKTCQSRWPVQGVGGVSPFWAAAALSGGVRQNGKVVGSVSDLIFSERQ